MAVLLISFDKTGSQERFQRRGETGFIVPTHSTELYAYGAQSCNLKKKKKKKKVGPRSESTTKAITFMKCY